MKSKKQKTPVKNRRLDGYADVGCLVRDMSNIAHVYLCWAYTIWIMVTTLHSSILYDALVYAVYTRGNYRYLY